MRSAYTPRKQWTKERSAMDKIFLQLSEIARAGWSLQIIPEQDAPTMPAPCAVVLWSFEYNKAEPPSDERVDYPVIDWMNLFAPEIELRTAVAKMHARIFPIPPFGNITA
jgi:hypothetical protein